MKIKINDNNISITDFCKSISVNRTIFINYLLNNKYIYVQYYGTNKDRRKNISFPKYDTENGIGLFEMNKNPNQFNFQKNNINLQITNKGQEYFKELLKKEGIIYGNT